MADSRAQRGAPSPARSRRCSAQLDPVGPEASQDVTCRCRNTIPQIGWGYDIAKHDWIKVLR